MCLSTSTFGFLASVLVLALAPHAAHAGITAFSGTTCNGAAGADVPCDGSCHSFGTRHSFRIDGAGTHCVSLYELSDCPATGQGVLFAAQGGVCETVNTGAPVQSFRCSPNDACRV